MPEMLPDIKYIYDEKRKTVDSDNSLYMIQMYPDERYFSDWESRNKFISAVEKLVRGSDQYKKYINHLKKVKGLNYCQVMPNVTDQDAPIEMHHGPILTLYDICDIMIEYYLVKKYKISTFRIATAVLEEHFQERVQTVMLCETVHQQVHNGEIWLNYEMAHGDLNKFVKKYGIALSDEYINKINRYIDKSISNDTYGGEILELNNLLFKLID